MTAPQTPPVGPLSAESVQEHVEKVVRDIFYGGPLSGATTRLASALIRDFRLTTPSDQGEGDAFDGLDELVAEVEASPEYATETVAAEAYQVIGTIASAGGLFDHPDVQRALDYFGGDREGEILPFAVSTTTPASGSDGLENVAWRWQWPGTSKWYFADYNLHAEAETSEPLVTREAAEKERTARLAAESQVAALKAALTPSGATKAAYHGEFKFPVTVTRFDDEGEPEEATENVYVPWTTVKEIMAAIQALALKEER